ncbi:oxygen-insensitive NADPH nitroreductase [Alteribacillus sp. JSM 102045]|uniref:oxygen-insensitive NADPH nitroreductase n=1 Tax=Alteribacillus sp. JSM 102045 TaxID=1562101 RepID=UPI0035BED335
MNTTIETILNHRSVRAFTEEAVPQADVEIIVEAAQAASTSSFLQAYSIIGITDQEKKKNLAVLAGSQSYVVENGYFFVFCADLYRLEQAAEQHNTNILQTTESTEAYMISLIDAALAAQNAAIAAESMGLGICYIGGIRNNLKQVCELLQTPERVLPLFGMAVGYPKQIEEQKPRLPKELIFHENYYKNDKGNIKEELQRYDQLIADYYLNRTNGKKEMTWTKQVSNTLERSKRLYLNEFVKDRGFLN